MRFKMRKSCNNKVQDAISNFFVFLFFPLAESLILSTTDTLGTPSEEIVGTDSVMLYVFQVEEKRKDA